ncbi:MAG: protein kinase [Deltaproteobacteria bacterium]|nr:protein kinase [Deltaproteobacteria bacterium]
MGMTFGKYELVRKIATGGMAEIWLARQTGMQGFEKPVVIKRILPHLGSDQNFVKMFLDEARMAASLNHPNIVQIYDLGTIEGRYYIAMEFVDGVDVSTVLKMGRVKRMPMKLGFTLRIVSQACEGLHHAHFMTDMNGHPLGIVHRDISPQNILIAYNGTVKITDFGIAKARGRTTKTTTGTLKGKFGYMSHEQISGKGIDHRSDVFSLGVVLWEMITYRRLFKRENEAETIKAILLDEIPSPRKFWPGLSNELERISMKALEKNPDNRYQTARELGDDLEKYLASQGAAVIASEVAQFLRNLFPEKNLSTRGHSSISGVSAAAYREPQSDSKSLPPAVNAVERCAGQPERQAVAETPPPAGQATATPDDIVPLPPAEECSAGEQGEAADAGEEMGPTGESVVLDMNETDNGAAQAAPATLPAARAEEDFGDSTPVTTRSKALLIVVPLALIVLGGGAYVAYTQFFAEKVQPAAPYAKAARTAPPAPAPATADPSPPKQAEPAPQKPEPAVTKPAQATEKEAPKKEGGKTTKDAVAKTDKQPAKTPAAAKEAETSAQTKAGPETGKKVEAPSPPAVASALPPAPPPPVQEVQPAGDGFLSLDCEPWAEVWSGGSKLGDTPLIKLRVPAGKLQLVLKNPDLGFEKRVSVAVAPDQTASQSIAIKKGVLNVRTDLPSEVYINKKKVGVTPFENYEIFEGSYKMRLVNREKEIEKIIPLTIAPGQTKSISETLGR